MRYTVQGFEIRTENAAKPALASGQWVLDWIAKLPPKAKVLDLGCGKLRYTIPLAKRVASVSAVDSEVQLARTQKIAGYVCSVREYIADFLDNVEALTLDDKSWRIPQFDIALCANVLSAIPSWRVRAQVLISAHSSLKPEGRLLVTTQFRNSHFSGWKTNPHATHYLDGYLVEGTKGTSFYGLIDAGSLRRLCLAAGFRISRYGHAKETAFVLAIR